MYKTDMPIFSYYSIFLKILYSVLWNETSYYFKYKKSRLTVFAHYYILSISFQWSEKVIVRICNLTACLSLPRY